MFTTPEEAMASYEKEIAVQSFDAVAKVIAPDAVFWFTNGSHIGLAAIRQAFEETWLTLVDETYWLTNLHWQAKGDRAAACTYQFNWKATVDGKPASGSGRGTTVLENRDGSWLIVHEHLSPDPRIE
ncbi:YybH family protein [Pelagibacterium lentulum]|uniref:SnoaL-like domain-containing protein n=1 Tax=Pelagibacterium lentulum TaxID=2029865 RepID=A0A916VUC4_9HYPH|nr:nuclear transport factor 2 family protein [Pelagibacterium lentulum]GGA35003.1 hypothetical protein GCM10011499_00380 [Pelagibacterium lentulum]